MASRLKKSVKWHPWFNLGFIFKFNHGFTKPHYVSNVQRSKELICNVFSFSSVDNPLDIYKFCIFFSSCDLGLASS